MITTFIIPNKSKHTSRYRLTDVQAKENEQSRIECKNAYLEFIKASLLAFEPNTKWNVVLYDAKDAYNASVIINDVNFVGKLTEKFILVDNNGSTRHGTKMSAQIYYSKELTIKKHGKKLYDVVRSMLNKNAERITRTNNRNTNEKIAEKFLELFRGVIPIFESSKEGFSIGFNDKFVYFKFAKEWLHNEQFIINYDPQTGGIYTLLKTEAASDVFNHSYPFNDDGKEAFAAKMAEFQKVVETMNSYAKIILTHIEKQVGLALYWVQ